MRNSFKCCAEEICYLKGEYEYFVKFRSEMILYSICGYDDDFNAKSYKIYSSGVFQFLNLWDQIMNHSYSPMIQSALLDFALQMMMGGKVIFC